jgi:hypothetical protein
MKVGLPITCQLVALDTSGKECQTLYAAQRLDRLGPRSVFQPRALPLALPGNSPIYIYKGSQVIRSKDDAEYFVSWIDDITKQAQAHPDRRIASAPMCSVNFNRRAAAREGSSIVNEA